MTPIEIIICRRAGSTTNGFEARVGSRVAGEGNTPFLDACRNLIDQGHDKDTPCTGRMESLPYPSFTGTLGQFAYWAVSEGANTPPRFVKYKPHPFAKEKTPG